MGVGVGVDGWGGEGTGEGVGVGEGGGVGEGVGVGVDEDGVGGNRLELSLVGRWRVEGTRLCQRQLPISVRVELCEQLIYFLLGCREAERALPRGTESECARRMALGKCAS